jgi:SpoVK/Ycf46/Vps4 family AAA+-type ATPase
MKPEFGNILYYLAEKSKKEFEKAKRDGDIAVAKAKARDCAHYYKLMAKECPSYAKGYLAHAEEWEGKAEQVTNRKPIKKDGEPHEGSPSEEEYKSRIESLIVKPEATWEEIAGQEKVKQMMMETIVVALMNKPESIKPRERILLFGPPGTGKTKLAEAAAGSLQATFINVQKENLTNKYFGESSRIVSTLYSVARERAPAIIFIDEIDSLTPSRDLNENDATKDMISTLLVELDGLAYKKSKKFILTLAATNKPWSLDNAVLSRFTRRINVTLPNVEDSSEIIKKSTKGLDISKLDLMGFATTCVEKMYSGRDIFNLCLEAIMYMVREENNIIELASLSPEKLIKMDLKTRPLAMKDFQSAFENIKTPLSKRELERYDQWGKDFGE